MYQKYNQHPELIRLIGAVAVSQQFRQMLLQNPEQILEHGCLGYQFNLTTEEAAFVTRTAVGDIREFSLQLWEWMGQNGHGNGSCPGEKLSQTVLPFEDAFASAPASTVPRSVEEEEEPAHRVFASEPISVSWNGR